ncbi:MAG: polyribonucleotide nucleotidyltransferase [Candidatus Dadabacteria bacterium]|nr:polyribonucleotide nucleotidyltransferase [Candidatus Dadabacteria bacterium]MDE0663912.1 polyribonucleotide nucleotidyltransferase [Candidatus Dadabacteria bacterium]
MEAELFGAKLRLETGRLAKQASGAVLASCGGTTVLATVVASEEKIEDDFLPLTVNYQEKSFAAGKIPGGYFKREGRPSEKEILTSRLIDRPVRPLIPKGFSYSTQVIVTVISADGKNATDVLSVIASSAALMVSDIPFAGPIAALTVGKVDGELVINPSPEQLETSTMEITVAGTEDAIVMVEGGAKEVSEAEVVEALMVAHDGIKEIASFQNRFVEGIGKEKREVPAVETDNALESEVRSSALPSIEQGIVADSKDGRKKLINQSYEETVKKLIEERPEDKSKIDKAFDELIKDSVRSKIVDGTRPDGRDYTTVRPIWGEVGLLERTHGSALFTRGETQAIVVTTLGSSYDEQRIDALEGDQTRSFMLHYNFPPYSVGETSFRLGPGRREIGHGALAARAIKPVLPDKEDFPYTIRIVSEILESNGSSSMATVCGSSMSLMDAGVPISAPVAGIAMGLIKEGDNFVVLSDILGDEDHLGDMDFKVAGTQGGITALQMDIKITGINEDVLTTALAQAKDGRMHILGKMEEVISGPKEELSEYAPRILTIQVKPDKVKVVIGSGGKTIKQIVEDTGAQIDIQDDGLVKIFSPDYEACKKAEGIIKRIVEDIVAGKLYVGVVKRILDFGAIVELGPGKDGLLHISELENRRVEKVTDILNEKDEVLVKCLAVERDGRVRLSRKAVLDQNIEDYRVSD